MARGRSSSSSGRAAVADVTTRLCPPSRRQAAHEDISCQYSGKLKFAFLFVPKNTGTAIEANLNNLLCATAGESPGFGLWLEYKEHVTEHYCPCDLSYFLFAFTRNPWLRIVSM